MENNDVVLVVGANDVVNSAAQERERIGEARCLGRRKLTSISLR